MESFRLFEAIKRQSRFISIAAMLLIPMVASAFAAADQVADRSIQLSSSSAGATDVAYTVNFKAVQAAGAFVVEFCSDTPLIGSACTAPTGFNASAAASATAGVTGVTSSANNNFTVAKPIIADEDVSVAVTGITNPDAAGALYARVVTYADTTDAATYTSQDLGTGPLDDGSVAISITNTVGVSGAVLETMTFCVSGPDESEANPITTNCGGTLVAPTLKLGNDSGSVVALDSSDVYEGTIFTQISTNAANGAVVRLKSNAVGCGGLIRSSDTSACDITPAGISGDIAAGDAKFGLKLGANVTDPTDGDFQAASASYSSSAFRFNYVAGDATGVTSVYGDPILDTNGKPADNRNMPLTFGASVANNTPAGSYSTDLSLIATGKF